MTKSILILSAYPFTNETAGQRNTNSVIDELIAVGYEVHAICFSYPKQASENIRRFKTLKTIKRSRFQSYVYAIILFFVFPLYTRRLSLRVIYFLLRHQSKFKYVFFDYGQTFIYSYLIRDSKKVILNVHDVNIQKYHRYFRKRIASSVILPYIFFSENLFFKKAGNVLVPSLKDKKLLRAMYKRGSNAVLPKGSFQGGPFVANECADLNKFLFIGAWNRYENVQGLEWFIENVSPLLKKNYRFVVAGINLPESISKKFPGNFLSVGFVNDLDKLITEASAVIAPLFFGAGIKFKVLDALSNGCRVIGTPIAFEGIEMNLRDTCFVCDSAWKFREAVDYCSGNSFQREPVIKAFRNFLKKFETASNLIERNFA